MFRLTLIIFGLIALTGCANKNNSGIIIHYPRNSAQVEYAIDEIRTAINCISFPYKVYINFLKDPELEKQAFKIAKSRDGILIAGGDETGLMYGGQNWQDTNGNNPDFFLFENGSATDATANPDSPVTVQAIFTDNSLGQSISLVAANWAWTGLNKVGTPDAGRRIFGTSFAITDLKDAAGVFLTNTSIIKGLRISNAGLDPAGLFAAVEPGPNSHWQLNEGDGTITVDSNSNSYPGDGTLIGNIEWAVGPNPVSTPITTIDFGSALSFPAGSGYVDCGTDVKLQQITNKMTLAARVSLWTRGLD
jgi:hypothetical protein